MNISEMLEDSLLEVSKNLVASNKFTKSPPKWCREKAEKAVEQCWEVDIERKPSPPHLYTKDELIDICEPPALKKTVLKTVLKTKANRRAVDDQIKESVAYIDFLKQRLKEVKETIEKIARQLECPVVESPPPEVTYGEDGCPLSKLYIVKQHHNLRKDLLQTIDEEDELTSELQRAQKQLWKAAAADNMLSVEVESHIAPALEAYDKRQDFLLQKRAFRENELALQATKLRNNAVKAASSQMKASDKDEMARKVLAAKKLEEAKEARRRIAPYIHKTIRDWKTQKMTEFCDQQRKQDRQYQNLSRLKTEIEIQREELERQNRIRRERLERLSQQKEFIRQEFLRAGKNPYYVEELLAIEEKRAIQQRNALQKETERLLDLQREYEAEERAKKLEETNKQHWDSFWSENKEKKKKSVAGKDASLLSLEGYGERSGTPGGSSKNDEEETISNSVASVSSVKTTKSAAGEGSGKTTAKGVTKTPSKDKPRPKTALV